MNNFDPLESYRPPEKSTIRAAINRYEAYTLEMIGLLESFQNEPKLETISIAATRFPPFTEETSKRMAISYVRNVYETATRNRGTSTLNQREAFDVAKTLLSIVIGSNAINSVASILDFDIDKDDISHEMMLTILRLKFINGTTEQRREFLPIPLISQIEFLTTLYKPAMSSQRPVPHAILGLLGLMTDYEKVLVEGGYHLPENQTDLLTWTRRKALDFLCPTALFTQDNFLDTLTLNINSGNFDIAFDAIAQKLVIDLCSS